MSLNFKILGKGEPLLILHGLLGSLDNWISIAKELSGHFQVILIDLPDHGKSPHSDHFSYQKIAEQVNDFMIKNKILKFSIMGHSMGGKVAVKLVDLFEENINKLIVVDIINREYSSSRFNHIFDAFNHVKIDTLTSRNEADALFRNYISNEGERNFILKNLKRTDSGFHWAPNIKLLNFSLDSISSKIILSKKISAETLFLMGENSNYFSELDLESLSDDFKNYKISRVSNSGHWVHAENPIEFIKNIHCFFKL